MRTLSLIVAIAFLPVLSAEVFSQASRGVSAAGRRMDEFDNQRRKADRDSMDREIRGKKPSKEELQNAARIKAETKEDLEELQLAYNDAVSKLTVREGVSREYVVLAAEKINKHATRLKVNIALPKSDKDDETTKVPLPVDKRKQLQELCVRLYQLLTNPMIENPNVLDVDAAGAAERLLQSIVVLSDHARLN